MNSHFEGPQIPVTTVQQLKENLDQHIDLCLLDVRENWEFESGHLPNALHIPLGSLFTRIQDLPQNKPIVVYCHHGSRSQRACELLKPLGFGMVSNLEGGIDAWSCHIDPQIKRY